MTRCRICIKEKQQAKNITFESKRSLISVDHRTLGGHVLTFDEIDFMKRDWVPNSGWPITRKDLDHLCRLMKNKTGPYQYDLQLLQDFATYHYSIEWKSLWMFCNSLEVILICPSFNFSLALA